ncbi:hypothetical protein [Cohnella caldifontis]|uniref:hypothetical protein n=1 Tax=Cohnella caldifontis TaxID=3027471 RepID=UPI0023EDF06E|nr:hypothetical protein [Cohnella sp. YIM B05605]
MPSEYTAGFLWLAASILWWSGWREESAKGIPHAAVAVFLAGWPFAAWLEWPLGRLGALNGAFVWTLLAAAALLWRMRETKRWMALSAGLLVSSLAMGRTAAAAGNAFFPEWMSGGWGPAAAGAAVFLLVGGADGQIAAVTLSLAVPELLAAAWHPAGISGSAGSSGWMDGWWTAVFAARCLSIAYAAVRSVSFRFAWRKGGERT